MRTLTLDAGVLKAVLNVVKYNGTKKSVLRDRFFILYI